MANCPLPPGAHVWAYLRDSGGTGQERSAEQQLHAAQTYCHQHSLDLAPHGIYIDAVSGATDSRTQFLAMIHELRRLAPERGPRDPNAPHGILYWDLKRFARNQNDGAYYAADLRRRGYTLISLSDDIPPGDFAPVIESFLRWKAQQDLEDLSKDVKRGHKNTLLATGPDGHYLHLWTGRTPKGYRLEPYQWGAHRDGKPRVVSRLQPDTGGDYERIIAAFEMRAAGASFPEIHDQLHLFTSLRGYRRLMKNTLYIGTLHRGELIVENWIEPAIDRATWDIVQGRRRPYYPRTGTGQFALTGYLRCDCRRWPLIGSCAFWTLASGERKRYRYYACSGYRSNNDCHAGGVPADRLERTIYDLLATQALTPPTVRAMIATAPRNDQIPTLQARARQHQDQIHDLDTAIARLIAAIETGGPIPPLVQALQAREAERDQARRDLAAAHAALARHARHVDDDALIDDFCQNIAHALGDGHIPTIRRILEALQVHIQMTTRRAGLLTLTLPPEFGGHTASYPFTL